MRISKGAWLRAVWLQDDDAAIFKTRVDLAVRVERDILGLVAVAE